MHALGIFNGLEYLEPWQWVTLAFLCLAGTAAFIFCVWVGHIWVEYITRPRR